MIDPHGKNSVKEMLAGCIAVALYLAVCQFLVARNCALGVRTEVAVPEGTNVDAIAHTWIRRISASLGCDRGPVYHVEDLLLAV
jgi:hypothetical protein